MCGGRSEVYINFILNLLLSVVGEVKTSEIRVEHLLHNYYASQPRVFKSVYISVPTGDLRDIAGVIITGQNSKGKLCVCYIMAVH